MSKTTVRVDMPLDDDGFLRRECPTCERQFKWRPGSEENVEDVKAPEMYYCPVGCQLKLPVATTRFAGW